MTYYNGSYDNKSKATEYARRKMVTFTEKIKEEAEKLWNSLLDNPNWKDVQENANFLKYKSEEILRLLEEYILV